MFSFPGNWLKPKPSHSMGRGWGGAGALADIAPGKMAQQVSRCSDIHAQIHHLASIRLMAIQTICKPFYSESQFLDRHI